MKIDILGDNISSLQLIDSMPRPFMAKAINGLTSSEAAIVKAARASTSGNLKTLDKDVKLLTYMLTHKHTSPFEMVEFKFKVVAPLPIIRQWQRHRTWSYNEKSRRYTSDNIEFYLNPMWMEQSKSNKQASQAFLDDEKQEELTANLIELSNIAMEFYERALELGASREQARFFLPQNMYTTMYAKVNLKNLMDFCKQRNHAGAQYEMRMYAEMIEEEIIRKAIPHVYEVWKE